MDSEMMKNEMNIWRHVSCCAVSLENERDEQLFLLTRVIKKEVIDLADTMDVLAEVVSR